MEGKKMKKILAVLMTMSIMILSLAGCTANSTETNATTAGTDTAKETKTENKDVKKVGIVQIVEHPSLDTIRDSVIRELGKEGYKDGENIIIDYQNAQGDQSNLNSICKKFVGDKVDLIIAIATPSAQAAAAATKDIPIVFSAVTDPLAAKLVTDLSKPEANVTGTSDAIPVNKVLELCKELTPEIKSIGFLYTSSEVNSKSAIDEAKVLTEQFGLTYEEVTITNTSELQQAATSLAAKVDAIYTPTDNNIASAMPLLAEVGRQTGTPVYVGADSMVNDGGYATIGVNYEDLGVKTAQMVVQVLNGTPVSDIPVVTLTDFQKVINKTTATAINATYEVDGAIIVE
jgi:putative ABC transport system substrate-binding protein